MASITDRAGGNHEDLIQDIAMKLKTEGRVADTKEPHLAIIHVQYTPTEISRL